MTLVHFKCSKCTTELWLKTLPGVVVCPNSACQYVWAPKRAKDELSKGVIEHFPIPTS